MKDHYLRASYYHVSFFRPRACLFTTITSVFICDVTLLEMVS